MRHVYIAGPYRGSTAWAVERNVQAAERAAIYVARLSCEVGRPVAAVCPHTMYRNFAGTLTDQYWLDATASLLRGCQAVVLRDQWMDSAGSIAEEHIARTEMGIPVFEAPWRMDMYPAFRAWLAGGGTDGGASG